MNLYLDHNATSPVRPEVCDAVREAMAVCGNASSVHGHGRQALKYVEAGRQAVAQSLTVDTGDIIFTSGGTEANNMAIYAAVQAGCRYFLVSALDHPSSFDAILQAGVTVEVMGVNRYGQADMGWLENRLRNWDMAQGPPFVSLCAANSETGIIQPVHEAVTLTHAVGGYILVDSVQALGKIPIDFTPDYMSVSAHKIGGPMGIGALYVAPNAPFTPLFKGGGQELGRRAGTLNVAGIAGFSSALQAMKGLAAHTAPIRDNIELGLRQFEADVHIFGSDVPRLPNCSFFAVPDQAAMSLLMALDIVGISVSTGMACSSGKVNESRSIEAMGLRHKAPKGAVRISLGYSSNFTDAGYFLDAWKAVRNRRGLVSLQSKTKVRI